MLTLELDHVRKQYAGKVAVEDFSLKLNAGVYGLLGANGAGKTTLLRMICDILKPTSGRVLVNGMEIHKMGRAYFKNLGYLPQDFGYYPEMTAERFLRYLAELKAVPRNQIRERAEEMLCLVQLSEVRKRKLKTFSGGMLQRLGIAQAMLNDPEILILDEPTAGLDPRERIRFRNMISSFSENRIVLLSTHIVSDVESVADEILLMKQGKLLERGSRDALAGKLRGQVWECSVLEEEALKLQKEFPVSGLKNQDGKVSLRVLSEHPPVETATQAEPDLEDVYLYHFEELTKGS